MAAETPAPAFALNERANARIAIPTEGRSVEVSDEGITNAIKAVKDTNSQVTWLVISYVEGTTDKLCLLGSGSGDSTEFTPHLKDDIVAYVLYRVIDLVDGIPTNRFAYITWMGDSVPGIKKAKISTNKQRVTGFIGHYNIEILADQLSDLAEDVIVGKIQDASGSRMRVLKTGSAAETAARDNPVVKGSTSRGVGGKTSAGTGGGIVSHVPTSKQALSFNDEANLKSALNAVRADAPPEDWALFNYDGKSNSISMTGTGTGGLEALSSHLDDSKAMFGLLRVQDTIDATTCWKFIFITWIGPGVSALQKGKIPTLRGSITTFFEPYHCEISAQEATDLSVEIIADRIKGLGNK